MMDPLTIVTTIASIIKVIDQASRLITALAAAPAQFATVLDQIKTLTSVLSDVHTDLVRNRTSIINRSKALKEKNRLDLDDLIKQCAKGVKRVQKLLDDHKGVTKRGFWNRDSLNWTREGRQEIRESLADLQSLTGLVTVFITKEVAQGVGRLEHEIEEQKRADRRRERRRNREMRALFAHQGITLPPDPEKNIANLFTTGLFASLWLGRLRTRSRKTPPQQSGRVSKPTSGRTIRPVPSRKDSLRSAGYQTRLVEPQSSTTTTTTSPVAQLRGWRVVSGSFPLTPTIHHRGQLKRTQSQLRELVEAAKIGHKALDRRHHAVKWLMNQLGSRWKFVGGRSEGGDRFAIVVKRD